MKKFFVKAFDAICGTWSTEAVAAIMAFAIITMFAVGSSKDDKSCQADPQHKQTKTERVEKPT